MLLQLAWPLQQGSRDRVVSGCRGGRIYLWDVNSGREIEMFGAGSAVRCLAALPDGTVIADEGEGRLIRWDVTVTQGGDPTDATISTVESITSVAVLYESVVVAGHEEGSLMLWDTTSSDCELNIRGHGATVWALASLPNKRFVAAEGDGLLKVWRVHIPSLALTCLQTLRGHARAAFCLAVLPDGRIVSGSMDRTLRFWAPVGTQIDRAPADV